MPPSNEHAREKSRQKTLQQLVDDVALYPAEAYDFIQQGLSHTVQKTHGDSSPADPPAKSASANPEQNRHVSGQQLCQGLREFALMQWGLLAGTVLRHWNITSTLDFGRIVFALIEVGHMQRQDDDTLDDFRDVYDFRSLDADYRIPVEAAG